MSSTPIYDELAARLLVDHPVKTEAKPPAAAAKPAEDPAKPVRTGGRRRKPEPDA
ncbi:hypothetical protein AB0I60_13150 [Actinosynnema sp. NPDC050436]|uniref:hypothetical protein n=1 Tax=Actinosynnema sp. NPDC050436 TaxID=3155659 RepID=UPI00340A62C0